MFDIFLQVDTVGRTMSAAGEVTKTESVWSMLGKGGPLMIPLFILFALAVFFLLNVCW